MSKQYNNDGQVLSFELTNALPNYINNSNILSFELKDYDQESLEFAIVLEFFNESGGVF